MVTKQVRSKRVYNRTDTDPVLRVIAFRHTRGETIRDLAIEFGRNPSTTGSAVRRLLSRIEQEQRATKEDIVAEAVDEGLDVGKEYAEEYPTLRPLYRRRVVFPEAALLLKEMGDHEMANRLRFRLGGSSPLEEEILRYFEAHPPTF